MRLILFLFVLLLGAPKVASAAGFGHHFKRLFAKIPYCARLLSGSPGARAEEVPKSRLDPGVYAAAKFSNLVRHHLGADAFLDTKEFMIDRLFQETQSSRRSLAVSEAQKQKRRQSRLNDVTLSEHAIPLTQRLNDYDWMYSRFLIREDGIAIYNWFTEADLFPDRILVAPSNERHEKEFKSSLPSIDAFMENVAAGTASLHMRTFAIDDHDQIRELVLARFTFETFANTEGWQAEDFREVLKSLVRSMKRNNRYN